MMKTIGSVIFYGIGAITICSGVLHLLGSLLDAMSNPQRAFQLAAIPILILAFMISGMGE